MKKKMHNKHLVLEGRIFDPFVRILEIKHPSEGVSFNKLLSYVSELSPIAEDSWEGR